MSQERLHSVTTGWCIGPTGEFARAKEAIQLARSPELTIYCPRLDTKGKCIGTQAETCIWMSPAQKELLEAKEIMAETENRLPAVSR